MLLSVACDGELAGDVHPGAGVARSLLAAKAEHEGSRYRQAGGARRAQQDPQRHVGQGRVDNRHTCHM